MKNSQYIYIASLFLVFAFVGTVQAAPATVKLSISGDDDKLIKGQTLKVRVLLKSTDPVNIVGGNLQYDTSTLEIVKVDRLKSITNLWMFEPKKDIQGVIKFGAAMIYPGFEGAGELFNIDVKFKGKATTSTIYFTDEQVFAADGVGSKTKLATTTLKLSLSEKPLPVKAGYVKVGIFSNSHEYKLWSNVTRASFNWPAGYLANFSFNTSAKSDPGKPTKLVTTANNNIAKDGTYYFHLRLRDSKGASKLYHYGFMVDTKKPTNFKATVVAPKKNGGLLSVTMKATDGASGLAYYNVIVDGKPNRTTANKFSVIIKNSGNHRVAVRAFDKAGNYQESLSSFIIN